MQPDHLWRLAFVEMRVDGFAHILVQAGHVLGLGKDRLAQGTREVFGEQWEEIFGVLLPVPEEKMVVEEELGIPVLIIERDYVDSRNFNEQQVRTRLETFAEIVKTSRAGKRE